MVMVGYRVNREKLVNKEIFEIKVNLWSLFVLKCFLDSINKSVLIITAFKKKLFLVRKVIFKGRSIRRKLKLVRKDMFQKLRLF